MAESYAMAQTRRSSDVGERLPHTQEAAGSPPAVATKDIDWEGIERDYRAGLLSVREIAVAYGVSHVAIGKRAKKHSWVRDLNAKIQAKAEAMVTKATVTGSVTAEELVTERQIIEANAQRIAEIRSAHRTDIAKARSLAAKLLAELDHQTSNQEVYEGLAELLIDVEGEDGGSEASKNRQRRRLEAFQRALSLGDRVDTMKKLAETLRALVGLEREAYGLEAQAEKPPGETEPVNRNEFGKWLLFRMRESAAAANDPKKPAAAA